MNFSKLYKSRFFDYCHEEKFEKMEEKAPDEMEMAAQENEA